MTNPKEHLKVHFDNPAIENNVVEINNFNISIHDNVSIEDKEKRIANRNVIETYKNALTQEVGSERGIMDEINDNGLSELLFDGVYVRELFIPKGITIVSELWNRERLWVILTGEVSFISELGRKRVKAPFVEMAPFGSRIALYAHEDTRWIAISRGNDCNDLTEIEEKIKAKDYNKFTYPWDLLEKKEDN